MCGHEYVAGKSCWVFLHSVYLSVCLSDTYAANTLPIRYYSPITQSLLDRPFHRAMQSDLKPNLEFKYHSCRNRLHHQNQEGRLELDLLF